MLGKKKNTKTKFSKVNMQKSILSLYTSNEQLVTEKSAICNKNILIYKKYLGIKDKKIQYLYTEHIKSWWEKLKKTQINKEINLILESEKSVF